MMREIHHASLPRLLKRAVLLVLGASRTPFHQVKDVAEELGCSPITLSHELHDAVNGAFTFTQFLGAVQLLRARELRRTMSWKPAAAEIGYSARALRTKAKRSFGMTLREMREIELSSLFERFRRDYIEPLLDDQAS